MKKRKNIVILVFACLLILLGGVVNTYGAQTVQTAKVDSGYTLKLDGKEIITPQEPVNKNDRLLVPARAVFEAMGGEVKWDGVLSLVTVNYKDTIIKLTINSTKALVNEAVHTLDVPAQIVNGHTLIPLRFVSESLGFGVTYDGAKQVAEITSPKTNASGKITHVEYILTQTQHRIKVTANEKITQYQDSAVSNPQRYIVDFKGFAWQGVPESISVSNDNLIDGIRTGQFAEDTARIVIDMKENMKGQLSLSDDKKTLYIDFNRGIVTGTEQPKDDKAPITGSTQPPLEDKKPKSKGEVVIVIDPGHGGIDPGSQGKVGNKVVLNEKDVNFAVASRLNQKLQAAGYTTVMTRTADTFADPNSKNASEDLRPRAEKANNINATLFISIHNNSVDGIPAAKGTETLYFDTDIKGQYGMSSKDLAAIVQKKMTSLTGTSSRGIKERSGLAVLRLTNMPAIIVEGAFLSNESDLKLMQTEAFKENYAQAVAEGIIEYLNQIYP